MAYDYSSESRSLELPNPYRVQNLVLLAAAVVLAAAGITGLVWARPLLQHLSLVSVLPLATGVALLAASTLAAAAALRRLRFFFGRGRPAPLAPELAPGTSGVSQGSAAVKELLRQGALAYEEPRGALNGLLYHWMPRLITAPAEVQRQMQRQFFNALGIAVTLLSFGVSWWLLGTEQGRPWISLLYFAFAFVFVVRPIIRRAPPRLDTVSLVLLVAAAVIGPVLASLLDRAVRLPLGLELHVQTTVMLVAALVAMLLALLALTAQVDAPPETQSSCEQLTLSMNAPPSALLDELERHLQTRWTEKIPNRRYVRLEPTLAAGERAGPTSGTFAGELLEETQPLPSPGAVAPSFGSAFAHARHRWLVLLDLWGLALLVGAAACSLVFIHQFTEVSTAAELRELAPSFRLAGLSVILALVAAYCFDAAQAVWGRFNFQSQLVWVELMGTWQSGRLATGNVLASRLSTESDVVRTESMTLRVWCSRVESVVFGKDGARQITAMFGTTADAKQLAAHLADFGHRQSAVMAPESREDQRRMGALGSSEALLAAAPGAPSAGALHDALRTQAALGDAQAPKRYCPQCGAAAAMDAKFCGECGKSLSGS